MVLVYIMLESEIFRQISEKLFAKDKKQHYCGDLVLGWEFSKRLFSTISDQDFNQNVGEVAYSICSVAYWPIAQNVGIWLGNKDKIYIQFNFLSCRNNGDQQIQNIFFLDSYTLCLWWMRWFVTHLIYMSFNQTHNAAMFSPKCETFALQIQYITWSHLALLHILFVLKMKLGTFLPIHGCGFWFYLKYIFVSLYK